MDPEIAPHKWILAKTVTQWSTGSQDKWPSKHEENNLDKDLVFFTKINPKWITQLH